MGRDGNQSGFHLFFLAITLPVVSRFVLSIVTKGSRQNGVSLRITRAHTEILR